MTKPFNPTARCYGLVLKSDCSNLIEVGAVGTVQCPDGWIYYVGRASHGWCSRFKRFSTDKFSSHWHIDYLVKSSTIEIYGVIPFDVSPDDECRISNHFQDLPTTQPLTNNFGASDCDRGCEAHAWVSDEGVSSVLSYFQKKPLDPSGFVSFEVDRATWHPLSS